MGCTLSRIMMNLYLEEELFDVWNNCMHTSVKMKLREYYGLLSNVYL